MARELPGKLNMLDMASARKLSGARLFVIRSPGRSNRLGPMQDSGKCKCAWNTHNYNALVNRCFARCPTYPHVSSPPKTQPTIRQSMCPSVTSSRDEIVYTQAHPDTAFAVHNGSIQGLTVLSGSKAMEASDCVQNAIQAVHFA